MMADSMVERVARIIDPSAWPRPGDLAPEDARRTHRRIASVEMALRILEAMKPPTEAMMDAAWLAMPAYVGEVSDRHLREALIAAVDATLSETEAPAPTERESV